MSPGTFPNCAGRNEPNAENQQIGAPAPARLAEVRHRHFGPRVPASPVLSPRCLHSDQPRPQLPKPSTRRHPRSFPPPIRRRRPGTRHRAAGSAAAATTSGRGHEARGQACTQGPRTVPAHRRRTDAAGPRREAARRDGHDGQGDGRQRPLDPVPRAGALGRAARADPRGLRRAGRGFLHIACTSTTHSASASKAT